MSPAASSSFAASPLPSARMPYKICSVPIYDVFKERAECQAKANTSPALCENLIIIFHSSLLILFIKNFADKAGALVSYLCLIQFLPCPQLDTAGSTLDKNLLPALIVKIIQNAGRNSQPY